MSWRQLPAITLILLGILLAAPLSSGDKGLWLSVAPTAALLTDAPTAGLPAEHSTILPDRTGRSAVAGRIEIGSGGLDRAIDPQATTPSRWTGEGWTRVDAGRSQAVGQPLARRAAPRAPPA